MSALRAPGPYAAGMFGRFAWCLCVVVAALSATGCMDRRITITSEPPGALVWLNDAEVGRTPVSTRFTWYGKYDVQLRLEGHEPIVTSQRAKMPVYEAPPLDLVASALPIRTELRWHYVLEPLAPEGEVSRTELLERARAFREGLEAQSP